MENVMTDGDGEAHLAPSAGEREPARNGFARLGLGPGALRAVASLGYETPTEVQERTIPILLESRDLIAQAPTGTGKTAAYGLPIVDRLSPERFAIDARDLHEVARYLRELSVEVIGEPAMRYGAHGAGLSIYVRDPEGNVVELKQMPPGP